MTNTDASSNADEETTVRIRGIYTTAITRLLETSAEADFSVVQASEPIRERFDRQFETTPADATVETTRDRQGVSVSGTANAVELVSAELADLAIDTFRWDSTVPRGAVFDAEVIDAAGRSGAVVDLGKGRGYLKYDDVDGYVNEGNRYRVQVTEPTPPWDDNQPRVEPTLAVRSGLCTLSQDRTGVSAAVRRRRVVPGCAARTPRSANVRRTQRATHLDRHPR